MPTKKIDFTQKFQQLEKITTQLESGSSDLEQSLKLFEQGLALAEELKSYLNTVENKVKKLKAKHA